MAGAGSRVAWAAGSISEEGIADAMPLCIAVGPAQPPLSAASKSVRGRRAYRRSLLSRQAVMSKQKADSDSEPAGIHAGQHEKGLWGKQRHLPSQRAPAADQTRASLFRSPITCSSPLARLRSPAAARQPQRAAPPTQCSGRLAQTSGETLGAVLAAVDWLPLPSCAAATAAASGHRVAHRRRLGHRVAKCSPPLLPRPLTAVLSTPPVRAQVHVQQPGSRAPPLGDSQPGQPQSERIRCLSGQRGCAGATQRWLQQSLQDCTMQHGCAAPPGKAPTGWLGFRRGRRGLRPALSSAPRCHPPNAADCCCATVDLASLHNTAHLAILRRRARCWTSRAWPTRTGHAWRLWRVRSAL